MGHSGDLLGKFIVPEPQIDWSLTALLDRLGKEDTMSVSIASHMDVSRAWNPRDVRVIPKSRDFH